MQCSCFPDDEQSDPEHKVEQFCGIERDGFRYGCPSRYGCNQCADTDPTKCVNGCPVIQLNPPAPAPPGAQPKKTTQWWWLWIFVGLALLVIIVVMFLYLYSS